VNIVLNDDLKNRAFTAYFKYLKRNGFMFIQPCGDVLKETVKAKDYIILYNGNGILSVFRIRPNGILKMLKRYPKEFDKLL